MEAREILEKYVRAGAILSAVRKEAVNKVAVGESLLGTAQFIENLIREKGGEPAFPVNISRNAEAAHVTPAAGDSAVFGKDMVKLDIGVHIDGYIADTAVTVDLSGMPELVEASEAALRAAIGIVRAGVNTRDIGAVIEQVITGHGFKPVSNLTGHGLERYIQHAPPTIPNKRMEHGVVLQKGDIVAIEPFATDGTGKVYDAGSAEIYHLVAEKPVRNPAARAALDEIRKYRTLPFAKRWLTAGHLDFALVQLVRSGIIEPYPILKEAGGGMVSQAKHTLLVLDNGAKVITE
ncbi:MAG TPA: type II methionyl aminopeptidase [Candidatus Methanoperedenaceae archaeon]|nr:type II methionyl aminopeptidase [Candidatus Methanoperedenaceae archaeon]